MCSKNIFFTLGFWVWLPQNLGFYFSVQGVEGRGWWRESRDLPALRLGRGGGLGWVFAKAI